MDSFWGFINHHLFTVLLSSRSPKRSSMHQRLEHGANLFGSWPTGGPRPTLPINYLVMWGLWVIKVLANLLLACRYVFKGLHHSTWRVLSFWPPTVGCWLIEKFVWIILEFAYFSSKPTDLSSIPNNLAQNSKFLTVFQHVSCKSRVLICNINTPMLDCSIGLWLFLTKPGFLYAAPVLEERVLSLHWTTYKSKLLLNLKLTSISVWLGWEREDLKWSRLR